MTIASLLVGTIAGQILFVLTKVLFFNTLNMESIIIRIAFLVVLTIFTIAVVRRMGILNYFESIFLVAVWIIVTLIVDLVITTSITGRDVYTTLFFWLANLVVPLALFLFHKKVHVEARKEKAAANK